MPARRMLSLLAVLLGAVALATLGHLRAIGATGEDGRGVNARSAFDPVDGQTAAFRAGVAAADVGSYTAAQIFATPELDVRNRQNLTVTAHLSDSGANCVVRVVTINKVGTTKHLVTRSVALTLTASTGTGVDAAGKYVAPTEVLPSLGGTHAYVEVVSISAGTVDLWVGSF